MHEQPSTLSASTLSGDAMLAVADTWPLNLSCKVVSVIISFSLLRQFGLCLCKLHLPLILFLYRLILLPLPPLPSPRRTRRACHGTRDSALSQRW
mmetsp:Transcript_80277/g.159567  ORF Transcript_80277/g.159567 Transcript_80277/m.159567 type:complete len:95 (+) Transcript_80277:222-506(+)